MTETLVDGTDFVIDMRPLPVLPEPIQSETAPSPLAEPLYVLLMVGSSLSWGAQPLQLWKSLMSGKIFSGPALIVVERWMRMVLGLVAAKRRTPVIRAEMTTRSLNSISRSRSCDSPYCFRSGVRWQQFDDGRPSGAVGYRICLAMDVKGR